MWPIPKKCSYFLERNATCSVSFEWHLWCITLTSFHWKKTCFSFGQEVASPSLSVVSHKRNLLIYVSLEWHPVCCTFCNHLSEQCPFFRVSSHFTTAVFVFLSMLIMGPRGASNRYIFNRHPAEHCCSQIWHGVVKQEDTYYYIISTGARKLELTTL